MDSFDGKENWTGDERAQLAWFLTMQRGMLLWKLEGLTCEHLQQMHPPSSLTLIGLVKHLTRVERSWLQQDLLGPDVLSFDHSGDEWHLEDGETCEDVIADYREAIRASDEIVKETPLDTVLVDSHPLQKGVTLRWALFHMIEETARHVGHADLIREAIDGQVGQNRWHP
ncbi:MAG TPA: DinB family protein [Thermomicrobiales bacterium]|nr:DinB family protein [Thermomicrobiales bacterium]